MTAKKWLNTITTIAFLLIISWFLLANDCEACEGKVCYSPAQNQKIKAGLAELIGSRKKIEARDKAIGTLRKSIKAYAQREVARRLKIATIDTELRLLRRQKAEAAARFRTAVVVLGTVAAAVVVGGVVVGVVVVVTYPRP